MTPKEYLQQYREAVRRADAALHHRDELRAMAERITPNYGGIGGSSHTACDALGETVAKLVDAEARVDAEIELLIATERAVGRVIDAVREPYRTLLYERYINGKTWEQIAVCMNYNYRWVLRLHGRALATVKQAIESHI